MKWWEIIPNAPCIFAIDSESVVDKDKITFTNNPNRFLTYINGKSKALSYVTVGYKYKDLEFEKPLKTYTYKSLNIWDTPLLFDTPVQLPNEFTFILKVKVNQSSIFLSNNGLNHGFCFSMSGSDIKYDYNWRAAYFETGLDKNFNVRKQFSKGDIKTLIFKGSLSSKTTIFNTDYGIYSVPANSEIYNSGGFLGTTSFNTLGFYHTDTAYRINSDIVAYGLFAKNMSDEEVNTLLNTIDTQFLEKESLVNLRPSRQLETSSQVFKNLKFKKNDYLIIPLQAGEAELPLPSRTVLRIFNEAKYIRNLYKKYETIEDYVYEEGETVQTKLYLYEKATGQLIKTTISDKNGYFIFHNLNEKQEYIVSAIDPKYQFKSISKDYNN